MSPIQHSRINNTLKSSILTLIFMSMVTLLYGQSFPGVKRTVQYKGLVNVASVSQNATARIKKGPKLPNKNSHSMNIDRRGPISNNTHIDSTIHGAVKNKTGALNSPTHSAGFLSIEQIKTTNPPDSHGAVGPDHVMSVQNSEVVIRNRSGSLLDRVELEVFTGTGDAFDPRVKYDPFSQRWIFVCVDEENREAQLLVFVSQSDNPRGNWNRYFIDIDPQNLTLLDFPVFGFNKDWIVVTGNLFTLTGSNFIETQVFVFNKADLYNGLGTTFSFFTSPEITVVPAATYDNTIDTIYLVHAEDGNSIVLSEITGPVGNEVFNIVGTATTVDGWSTPIGFTAPQLGSSRPLSVNDSRMHNVVYRNGTIWCSHTIFLPAVNATRSSIQWWQLSPTASILQRGRIDDPTGTTFYAYPSIGVNAYNDVLIGFSTFSDTSYAAAAYAFREHQDALNTIRNPHIFKAGESKVELGTTFSVRWGDYSHTVVDPDDDLTFWTIQEYAKQPSSGQDRWATWWARLDIDACPISHTLTNTITACEHYEASEFISATNIVEVNGIAHYDAASRVLLKPGFWSKKGSKLCAFIEGCGGNRLEVPVNNYNSGDLIQSTFASPTTSIGQETSTDHDHFYFYPNPAKDILNIEWLNSFNSDQSLFITDLQGRRIQQIKLPNSEQWSVDISHLTSGTYILELLNGERAFIHKKFIKL